MAKIQMPSNIKILTAKFKSIMYRETCCKRAYTRWMGVYTVDGHGLGRVLTGAFTVWKIHVTASPTLFIQERYNKSQADSKCSSTSVVLFEIDERTCGHNTNDLESQLHGALRRTGLGILRNDGALR